MVRNYSFNLCAHSPVGIHTNAVASHVGKIGNL